MAELVKQYVHYKKCPCCGINKPYVLRRRQNTAYEDEESNYVECCEDCFEQIESYWEERWQEYYSQVL
jgi:hypothetical protein